MPWKCPPLHLPNWNNLWKWKEQMNAKEFAHELEKAASFIRQQQSEIEALKERLKNPLQDRLDAIAARVVFGEMNHCDPLCSPKICDCFKKEKK